MRTLRSADVILALAGFAALVAEPLLLHRVAGATPLMVALAFATAAPIAFRRRFPLAALAADVPLLLLCLAAYHPNKTVLGIAMLLVFSAGLAGGRTRSLVIGAVMALVVAVSVPIAGGHAETIGFIAYTALVLGALAAGDALRARQSLQRALVDEAVRAGEATAQHRFDQERLALAHEVHDVVGHALVAINVRAAAAAHRAGKTGRDETSVVLSEIAAASAEALSELRTTLKALRVDRGPVPLEPLHDLAGLDELLLGVRETGLSVVADVAGDPRILPTPVSHAGYRIVQEGLTNVLRHSESTSAQVRIAVGEQCAVIEIVDPGPARPGSPPGHGHGLQGMRERAAVLGGSCEAGPVEAIGWRVRATIPLTGAGS